MIKPIFCITLLFCASAVFAVNAVVTDMGGQDYNVMSIKLAKGSKLKVACGETRMEVPFKSVKSMKIDRRRISTVDGQLYFGAEIRTGDGAVIGSFDGGGRCAVHAGNGFVGKTASKSKYSSPFGNVGAVEVLGKGDGKKGGDEDSEEDSEE
jgi:hypothetical protein